MVNRRVFLKSAFSASALSLLPFRFDLAGINEAVAQTLDRAHPIQVLGSSQISSRDFNGDSITRPHDILWDIEGYMKNHGGWPTPTEQANVVVVGGGIAGLCSTYFLRDQKPIMLEQAESFGGNSRGEQLGGSRYSIGAAYLATPEAGSVTAKLLADLQILNQIRATPANESMVLNGSRLEQGFWQGVTAPEAKAQFIKVHETLTRFRGSNGINNQLDRMTFAQWLTKTFGKLHPHIIEYFQLYAWSSFATSIQEISAMQMLDFAGADTAPLLAFPGGNSAISAALYTRLKTSIGAQRVRANCLVIDVRLEGDGVRVTYLDPNNQPRAIFAKKVIYAAPKFVAQYTVRDLPEDQKKAIAQIRYRSYVVANIFLNKPIQSPTFDLFCLQDQIPETPTPMHPNSRGFSDVCFGTWAQNDRTKNPVITLYHAFPYEGARQLLMNPAAHNKMRDKMIGSLEPLLSSINLKTSDIRGIRLTRWGHSLPVAAAGLVAGGIVQKASQPIANRIFFANQDNWANPCFETAAETAYNASLAVRGQGFARRKVGN